MQEFANPHSLRNGIFDLLSSIELANDDNVKLLDYTTELFNKNGLSSDYYGYHNIDHELEVTYITLLSATNLLNQKKFSVDDVKYLFASALLHDFDPSKSADKPHEKNVIEFITEDKTIQGLLKNASLDPAIICALISRTVYPWSGSTKTITEKQMEKYFDTSSVTKDKPELCEHFKMLGHFLSVADRIGGYALGDFGKAMEMAKMNAHASGWHPALIVRRSVSFFEDMLNNDAELCELLLNLSLIHI